MRSPFADQVSSAQNPSSGGSCNVTDNALRVQCSGGYCQTYSWSLKACSDSCANGGTGREFQVACVMKRWPYELCFSDQLEHVHLLRLFDPIQRLFVPAPTKYAC